MKYRVLIVDDEEDIRTIVRTTLAKDFEVIEAYDGLDALYKMKYSEPDLVVLDVMMPLMNGFECCSAIRKDEKFSDIPVLFLTALSDKEHIKQGYEAGANLYLTKPFEPARLKKNIQVHFETAGIQPRAKKYQIEQLHDVFERVKNLRGRGEAPAGEEGTPSHVQRRKASEEHLKALYGGGFSETATGGRGATATSAAGGAGAAPADEQKIPARVMVIDDDPELLTLMDRALSGPFEVVTAQDGIEAIERLVTYEPDIMLIDALMPRMSGFQLCQSVRRNVRFQGTYIIMMSGKSSERDKAYARRVGVDDFIAKPFEPGELLRRLNKVVDQGDFKVYPKRFSLPALREREDVWEREREARKQMRRPEGGKPRVVDQEGELERFIRDLENE